MRLRDFDPILKAPGNFFFKYRDALFPTILACTAIAVKPAPFLDSRSADLALDAAGLAVACLGQGIRILTIGYVYIIRGGKAKKVYAERLVTTGIFAHVRNPMYLGNLLVILGFALIHNAPLFYALMIPFFAFAYASIIAAEESFLRDKFGPEFEAYCARVNRLLPKPGGLRNTLASMRFDWQRVIRKEYGTLFTFITSILGLFALELYRFDGFSGHESRFALLAGLWLSAGIAWAVARILKKKKRLGSD
jgi:protein-S-isoprenylcysteine O-methyltransferase Ste14